MYIEHHNKHYKKLARTLEFSKATVANEAFRSGVAGSLVSMVLRRAEKQYSCIQVSH